MKPLDRLSDYLGAIERRLRLLALTRGFAATAGAALGLTVVAVLVANQFAFSNPSVIGARVFLFLGLAFAIAAALIIPVIRLNRRNAARRAEHAHPQFEERLLTFTERLEQKPDDPFLPLLAADALAVAPAVGPKEVAKTAWIAGFSSAAVASLGVLLWLAISGPGFLGYGAGLLWGGLPKGEQQAYYAVKVEPGNRTIRKRSDQLITATLIGFSAPKVRFFGKYASSSQWEQAEMRTQTGGTAYEFLIAGVPESLEYYVEAGGVRSQTYNLKVVDLPNIKRIRVTYHYPAWAGMPDATEDPGGDLRAVEGTTAEVAVETDRPLSSANLLLDDGTRLSLRSAGGNIAAANVPIQKDGMYHVAAAESGEDVRLSEDYFIEAQKDRPPEVRITRPGRDFKASPIEEVTIAVEAKDDFGLKDVELHYSVNGGPEKAASLLATKGVKNATGTHTIALEDFKVEPGDIVSLYAVAKDARTTTNTDMFFIETEPFERNYTQGQEGGGGGGGGDMNQQNEISQRQKEIITATWNEAKGQGAKGTAAENAAFLSSMQSKLRDQARSLAERMKARQLEGAGQAFKSFVEDMEKAAEAMGPASEKLKAAKWNDALPDEQKALQHILRAEATFRDIQVTFGRQGGGGGGGGGGATRDLQGLFDLELDTEKNQYEGARQMQNPADQRQKEMDDLLEKLKQLAKRQQELAEQQKRGQMTPQQRYEQEMLRRDAEQLQKQMEQMQRQSNQLSRDGQPNQQGQQSQSGNQPGQAGQSGQQSSQQSQANGQPGGQSGQQQNAQNQQNSQNSQNQQGNPQGQQSARQQMQNQLGQDRLRGANPQQMQRMLDQLQQSINDMRQAASSQQAGTPEGQAAARRAAERLKDMEQAISGMRRQQNNSQIDNMAQQADNLVRKQQDVEGQMRRTYGAEGGSVTRDQAENLARQKEGEVGDLKRLEQDMQSAIRDLQSTNRPAASKLREALGQAQQEELARDMQRSADYIRRGAGAIATMQEPGVTQSLGELRDKIKQVQQQLAAAGKDGEQEKKLEDALSQVEHLRRQAEQLAAQGQRGQMARGQQQGGRQQGGQQQGGQQQNGQQAGGQQQGGQQQGGQQQGGQQAGGQQQGGQQQGGQQQGGQQQGGQQAGGQQQSGGGPGGGGPQGAPGNRGGDWNSYGPNWGGNPWARGNPDPRNNNGYNGQDGPIRPQDFQQTWRDTMQTLNQLESQLRDDPSAARDVQGMVRDLRQADPFAYSNDTMLNERIQAALAGIQQVEMELRRKLDDTGGAGGAVRSPGGEKVPQGYEDKVADYFRKLSKSK